MTSSTVVVYFHALTLRIIFQTSPEHPAFTTVNLMFDSQGLAWAASVHRFRAFTGHGYAAEAIVSLREIKLIECRIKICSTCCYAD
jgi:hypothetical protein